MDDTIAAISTALGIGSISIIRVSGEKAIEIVNRIFKGKDLSSVKTHTITYGHIIDKEEIIDEVLVSIMKAPRSFTMEDVVEINGHGGIASTKKILQLLYENGARPADPGEFTKRAFLNGRIDLLEAEGVMDLIESKTEQMRKVALGQVQGRVSSLIHKLRDQMVGVISHIEVNIDYPEYDDIKELTTHDIIEPLLTTQKELAKIIEESKQAKLVKEGIVTSIIGRPNVGKSSLLNVLLDENKAIVTDIPGTTRDTVEGTIYMNGILLHIIDTAGIRKTEDTVEKIGVEKSLSLISQSELVLYILNYNTPIIKEDIEILEKIKDIPHIIIINKVDLEKEIDVSILQEDVIYMSTKEDTGMEDLRNRIRDMYHLEEIDQKDPTYISNARSIALLKKAMESVNSAIEGLQNGSPIDMVEIDVKEAWGTLGEITGETYTDELIDELFSRFCLGK